MLSLRSKKKSQNSNSSLNSSFAEDEEFTSSRKLISSIKDIETK